MSEDLFYDANRILQPDFGVSFTATLEKNFCFVNGDEAFYKFIGKNSGMAFTELLWEEDIANFVEALENLPNGPQVFMGKIKAGDDSYYSLFFMLSYNGKVQGDFKLIDVDMLDFPNMKQRYMDYVTNSKKFNCFLSLLPHFFFEYNMKNDIFVMYRYINQKPTILFNEKLKEFLDGILSSTFFTQEDKIALFNFYENLKDDSERFETVLPASTVRKENAMGYYKFKGTSFYEAGRKTKKIGVAEKTEALSEKVKYYLTENAYDTGTGLFNKRAINEYAIDKLQECGINGSSIYLAVMDIDDFKTFNDTYGHMFGDRVLAKIADIMRSDVDYKGSCGRFGGDEFMVVFDGVKTEEELRNILKTIRKNISFAFIDGENKINVTTSWGVSKFPDDGDNFEKLFELADKSLYIAKQKGKDRFIIYDEKKHGDIAITDDEKRNMGFHNLVSTKEKGRIVSQIILDLNQNGLANIDKNLNRIREYFDIDGIAIYKGKKLGRLYESGKYVEPIQKLDFALKPEYQDFFDEDGILAENIVRIKNIIGDSYKLLELQETTRVIQCKAGEDETLTIVSFDFFNRTIKVAEADFSFLTMMGSLIANIVSKQ